jgi:hypothetical protein
MYWYLHNLLSLDHFQHNYNILLEAGTGDSPNPWRDADDESTVWQQLVSERSDVLW